MELLSFDTTPVFLEESRRSLPPDAPVCVFLMTSLDYTGTLSPETPCVTAIIKTAATAYQSFFIKMRDANISKALTTIELKDRKIDLLVIFAHGDETVLDFSDSEDGRLDVTNVKEQKLELLSDRVKMLFCSCKAGVLFSNEFLKKLPLAQIWSSTEEVDDAVLLNPHPDSFEFMLLDGDRDVTTYPDKSIADLIQDWEENENIDAAWELYYLFDDRGDAERAEFWLDEINSWDAYYNDR